MRTTIAAALLLVVARSIVGAARADDDSTVPFADTAAKRTADASAIEASAVGLADPKLPMVQARCEASRRIAERRAKAMIHDYVDVALRTGRPSPRIVERLHRVVDAEARVTGVRGLADCGAVVRVAVPFSSLASASQGAELRFP